MMLLFAFVLLWLVKDLIFIIPMIHNPIRYDVQNRKKMVSESSNDTLFSDFVY